VTRGELTPSTLTLVAEKITHEAPTASGIREVEKSTFFLVKMGFSLLDWLLWDLTQSVPQINFKCDILLILARREFYVGSSSSYIQIRLFLQSEKK
jgi:hypothetical protein